MGGQGKLFRIGIEIGGKLSSTLSRSIRSAELKVAGLGKGISRTFNNAALSSRRSFKGFLDNALWQQSAAGVATFGLAMGASIRTAASFESVMADIGKTADIGQDQLKALSGELLKLSGRNITNIGAETLAQGVQDLVAQGLNLKDAVASMESLGRVATATNSDLLDVTKTGFQLQNALKIRPTELAATFDALAYAGKQGAFELRDMAQFMPTIAAAAGTLGIQGKSGAVALAAMMQMVRKDAPDAGQATTRLTDSMLKLTAPDAVKRFQKFGVNIEQVLRDAKQQGVNPMEAALDELQRVTGGDVFKLSQIFGDKEAKLGLMSLMKYRKEYEKLKAAAGGKVAAGTVDKDYERSIKTFEGTLRSFRISSQRVGIALGNSLLPPMTKLAELITPVVEGVASWVAANPKLATALTVVGGVVGGLILALPVIAGVVSGVGAIASAIGALTAAFPVLAGIGTVLAVAGGPITLIVAGIVGIGAALVAAYQKVGWFRDGVNAAWNEIKFGAKMVWEGIKAVFGWMANNAKRTWQVLSDIVGLVAPRIGEVLSAVMQGVGGALKIVAGIFTLNADLITKGFGDLWSGWGKGLEGMKKLAAVAFQLLARGAGAAFDGMLSWGKRVWDGIVKGAQQMATQIVEGLKKLPSRLGSVALAIGKGLLDGARRGAGAAWNFITGGASPVAPAAPARAMPGSSLPRPRSTAGSNRRRALGGPVLKGVDYLVGEHRAEVLRMPASGRVLPSVEHAAHGGTATATSSRSMTVTIQPGAIQVTVGSGSQQDVHAAVSQALQQFRLDLETSYRALLND